MKTRYMTLMRTLSGLLMKSQLGLIRTGFVTPDSHGVFAYYYASFLHSSLVNDQYEIFVAWLPVQIQLDIRG